MIDTDFAAQARRALTMAAGDSALAVRLLTNLVTQDAMMLRAAVTPFLPGILLKAVQDAQGGSASARNTLGNASPGKPRPKSRAKSPQELPPAAMDALLERLGTQIPVARAKTISDRPPSAEEALSRLGRGPDDYPPPKAGAAHQSAIRTMARSFKL